MNKYIIFLLALITLFISPRFFSTKVSGVNHSARVIPTKTPIANYPADVETVSFDKDTLLICCPIRKDSCRGDEMRVKVTTAARDKEDDPLIYSYKVSGGRIIRQGAKVFWDFSGLEPKTYTIEVSVDDGHGFVGKAVTKTIELKDYIGCDPPIECICPIISVSSPVSSVQAGETIVFTADIKDKSADEIFYNWTVSQGEIIEGQGTHRIKVKTTPEMAGENLTATFQIGGTPPDCNCAITASESVTIKNNQDTNRKNEIISLN